MKYPYSWFQTSQTGGQWYSDTSPFSIPWPNLSGETQLSKKEEDGMSVVSIHKTSKDSKYVLIVFI